MRRIALIILISMLFASCHDAPKQAQAATATTTAAGATGTRAEVHETVAVEHSNVYGDYLTDDSGRTLYMFTADNRDVPRSACDLECAAAWPPYMYEGALQANAGASSSLVGKMKRPDGSTQITYNGWPLYYDKQDARPSELNGEGVTAFGGRWFLISPQGAKIEK